MAQGMLSHRDTRGALDTVMRNQGLLKFIENVETGE